MSHGPKFSHIVQKIRKLNIQSRLLIGNGLIVLALLIKDYRRLADQQSTIAQLQMRYGLEPKIEGFQDMPIHLLLDTTFLVFVILLIVHLLTRSITKPIFNITKVMFEVRGG